MDIYTVESMMDRYIYWETPRMSYDGTPKASTDWPYPDEHRGYHAKDELEEALKKALIKTLDISDDDIPNWDGVTIIKTLEYDGYEYEQDNKVTLEIKWGGNSHKIHGSSSAVDAELVELVNTATRRATMSDAEFDSMYAYAVENGWTYEPEEKTGWG